MFKYICSLLFFCLSYSLSLPAAALPVESFASLPDVAQLRLSPSGEQISAVIRISAENTKGTAVQVTDLKSGKNKLVLFTDNKKYDISWVSWKDEKTLLVGTVYPSKIDTWINISRVSGKTRATQLMVIDLEQDKIFTPFSSKFLKKYKITPVIQDAVIDTLWDEPDNLLMALPTNQAMALGVRSFTGVYKVNFRDQTIRAYQASEDHVYDWWADQQHRIRAGFYVDDKGTRKIVVKNSTDEKWQTLWPHTLFSEDEVTPLGFGIDPNILYIRAYHEKRLAIFKVNLTDKNLTRELVFSDPVYDVNGGLVYSPLTRDVIGITYSANGGFTFFDPDLKKLQASIDKAMPNSKNFIYAFSKDMQTFLVFSSSDVDSGTFYVGRRNPIRLNAVAYRYKQLESALMSPTKRYDYNARDGLAIEAYLTLPKNSAGKKLATIIFPHGGPIARDDDNFDYWTQYFADKGYAILQMNFRGSSGQGLDFRNAGLKNWGMEMQNDIEDGARKLIADGIADEQSLCILGASYGGYAALMGAVKTPDFYKCVVSVAGVSNVFELVKDNRAFWRSYNPVDEQIGNDNKHLKEISPVNYADKIKVPVLLVHGDDDRQVPVKHSTQMRDALLKAGKNVTYLELPDEDHYLSNNENRVATFKAIDSFLDKNLPVKK
jgi:dipeptidyl aminopeptidase/acylaminoacyl peptidase